MRAKFQVRAVLTSASIPGDPCVPCIVVRVHSPYSDNFRELRAYPVDLDRPRETEFAYSDLAEYPEYVKAVFEHPHFKDVLREEYEDWYHSVDRYANRVQYHIGRATHTRE